MQTPEEAEADYQRWRELLRDFDDRQNPEELRIARLIAGVLNGKGGAEYVGPYDWERMHWVRRQSFIDAARAAHAELSK